MARPKTGITPVRNVRISDDLWHPALAAARAQGDTITAVIERALRRYLAAYERTQPHEGASGQ
jgi:hypothetical protein